MQLFTVKYVSVHMFMGAVGKGTGFISQLGALFARIPPEYLGSFFCNSR